VTRSGAADVRYDAAFAGLAAVAHRVAYRLLGDRGDAEEIAQEALARAYARWGRVEGHAEAWVARVAANLALDDHRRRSRVRRHAEGAPAGPGADPDRTEGLVSRLELVAGLRALPRRQREVVVLRYLADASEADTAALLGCTPGTVKQHASRGLAALRLTVPHPRAEPGAPPPAAAPEPVSVPSPSRLLEPPDVRSPRRP